MKNFKKLIALMLTAVCLLTLAVQFAVAEEESTTPTPAETYSITVVCGEGGKAFIDGYTPVEGVYTIPKGTPVVIKAVSDTDKSIEQFKVGGVSIPGVSGKTNYEYSDSDMIDRTYEVKFKDDTSVGRDITFSGTGFTYKVNGGDVARANLGTTAHIAVKADEGMRIGAIKFNGSQIDITDGTEFNIVVGETNSIEVETTALGEQQPINITVKGEGTVTPDTGVYYPLSEVELQFLPAKDYVLKSVTVNGNDRTADVRNGKLTVITGENAMEVVAEFAPGVLITFNVIGSGTVTPDTGLYPVNSEIKFTFTPTNKKNDVWLFKSLIFGVDDLTEQVVDNTITLKIGEEEAIYDVEFGEAITVTPNISSGGKLLVNGDEINSAAIYLKGTDLEITVAPALGYALDTLRIDGVLKTLSAEGKYTIAAVSADVRIAVKFKITQTDLPVFTVSATAGEHGTITPAGDNDALSGESIRFTFTPDSGYIVDTVTVNGTAVNISGNSYTMTGITANSNIHVTFKKQDVITDPTDDTIAVTDIDWSRDTIYVNLSQKTRVEKAVFDKLATSGKACVFYNDKIKIMLPANMAATVASGKDAVDLDVEIDGTGDGFDTIIDYISGTVGNIDYAALKMSGDVAWPDGTTLSYNMGASYAGKSLEYLVLKNDKLASPTKPDGSAAGNRATVDNEGWICVYYFNDRYVTFCESLETRYTIISSASDGGSISPAGNKSVTTGTSATYSIVASDGYLIKSILIDGAAVEGVQGEAVYTYTFEHVTADHTIEAQFEKDSAGSEAKGDSPSSGVIVAIIIIILAVVAAGVLFFIRWKQEKY